MKQNINLGAYGWRQRRWLNTFYPEDLPEDWQLTYYSNAFNSVLVPSNYWQNQEGHTQGRVDCADWLDSVHDGFRFFVECHVTMLDHVSLAGLTANLKKLQPQLAALVFLDDHQQVLESARSQFTALIDSLGVDVYGVGALFDLPMDTSVALPVKNIWRAEHPQASNFAYIEHDLSDLRSARTLIENFTRQLNSVEPEPTEATIIVNHPRLQAADLARLRPVLEIMGY